jgi:hypothetical protein
MCAGHYIQNRMRTSFAVGLDEGFPVVGQCGRAVKVATALAMAAVAQDSSF